MNSDNYVLVPTCIFSVFQASIHAESKKLKAVGLRLYCDCGYRFNQATVSSATKFSKNVYRSENWNIVPNAVVTNTASNTYVRAPGTTQVDIAVMKISNCSSRLNFIHVTFNIEGPCYY